jgi:hypothetical protein
MISPIFPDRNSSEEVHNMTQRLVRSPLCSRPTSTPTSALNYVLRNVEEI